MTDTRDFVDYWVENSVHPDEQMSHRRGSEAIQKLADRLVVAANYQGFTKQQMETEIGDIFDFIRARVDTRNSDETMRIKPDGR